VAYLWSIAALLILVPLSVDNFWNIRLGNYDARISYLGAALAVALSLADPKTRGRLAEWVGDRAFQCWTALLGPGTIGWLWVSENPRRSFFYLVWTVGTLCGVPWVVRALHLRLGAWLGRLFVVQVAVQSIVVNLDQLLCSISGQKVSIARVFLQGSLCRPHAWYQEPNYFAAFGLIAWVGVRAIWESEKLPQWRSFSKWVWLALTVALLASTSRLSWVALPILGVLELAMVQKRRLPPTWKKTALATAACAFVVVAYLTVAPPQWLRILIGTHSTGDRLASAIAAKDVFLDTPWVGAGPGASGAYLVNRLPQNPVFQLDRYATPEGKVYLSNDPLSVNTYTELLSEWGLLGTVLFISGLVFLLRSIGAHHRLRLAMAICLVYATTQTLPRFDLWFAISLVWVSAPLRRKY
jgi:hypothetical protein